MTAADPTGYVLDRIQGALILALDGTQHAAPPTTASKARVGELALAIPGVPPMRPQMLMAMHQARLLHPIACGAGIVIPASL